MKTIAQRLKFARERKGWKQAQLAIAAGVSTGTIGNIESGVRQSKGSIPQIAEALGVNYKWLANGEGTPDQSHLLPNQPLAPVEPAQAAIERRANLTTICSIDTALKSIASLMTTMTSEDRAAVEGLITQMLRRPDIATHVIGAVTAIVASAKGEQTAKQQNPVYRTGTHD